MSFDGPLQEGERVIVRGDPWIVVQRTAFGGCESLRLTGAGEGNAGVTRTILTPFDRPRRVSVSTALAVVRPRRWLHGLRRVAAGTTPFGGLALAAASQLRLLPYQLEPCLAMLRDGAARVLLADAVGLGKTVQAGLILSQLAAGRDGFRALIIVPAGLRDQWTRELAHHFELPATIAESGWLRRCGRELPADVNPWVLPGIYVSSFDFLKRPEVLRPLEEVTWDAAVVDEAHGVTAGSARRAAVQAIALRSHRLLLLTATPHGGDAAQFAALCSIGVTRADDPPPLIFRRTRADAGERRPRRSVMFRIRLTPAERQMHRLLERYTARVCREARNRGDALARLAVIVLRKRALSSAASLAASARTRLALLSGNGLQASPERQLALPLGDEDSAEDDEPETALAAPGLADSSRECRWLAEIVAAATDATRAESKVAFLLRLLRRMREPAIIFTEYRDTLMRLERAIGAAGHRTALLHGGMERAGRDEARRAFDAGGVFLLATDAAAEGLNLHHRCRAVLHFELPWSPSRLEQRTGRVDRIGQGRTVHQILLVADDTAERLVLAPLARRAALASAALGDASSLLDALSERHIAGAVMDGEPLGPANDVAPWRTGRARSDTPDRASREPVVAVELTDLHSHAEAEVRRLLTQRAWSTRSGDRPPPAGIQVASLRRRPRSLAPGIIWTYLLSVTAGDGSIVHTETVAVHEPWPLASPVSEQRVGRRVAREFMIKREPALRDAIAASYAARLADMERTRERNRAALDRRARVISAALPGAASDLVQAGLFDQRAIRARAAMRSSGAALLDQAEAAVEARSAARCLSLSLRLFGLLILPGAGAR